jgi:outer membrane protein assembly factor BamB
VCEEPAGLVCLNADNGAILWKATHTRESLMTEEEKARMEKATAEIKKIKTEMKPLKDKERKLRKELKKNKEDETLKAQFKEIKKQIKPLNDKMNHWLKDTPAPTHNVNGYTSPTPVSDGTHVWVLTGSGVAACYTMEGQKRWARMVDKTRHGWGHSASPALAGSVLVIHVSKTVIGLDSATGETLWTTQSNSTWGSPIPFQLADDWAVITTGGDIIRADNGTVLAKKTVALPWASAIVRNGVIYVMDTKGARAVKLPTTLEEPFKTETLWNTKIKKDRYYSSPVLYQGLLYNLTQKGILTVLEADTGKKVYEQKVDLGKQQVYPSPTLAGDVLFISGSKGKTIALKPGRTYEELGVNQLEDFKTCLVVSNNRLYIRALKVLYCIGNAVD